MDDGNWIGRRGFNVSSKIFNFVKGFVDSGVCWVDEMEDDEDNENEFGVELNLRKVKERVIVKGFMEN